MTSDLDARGWALSTRSVHFLQEVRTAGALRLWIRFALSPGCAILRNPEMGFIAMVNW